MEQQPHITPIAPENVLEVKREQIPDQVIATVNELIAREFDGRRARIYQDEIVAKLEDEGLKRGQIYREKWLDFENLYREEGWKVTYDKPGYSETYRAFFLFEVGERKSQRNAPVHFINWQ